jgi:hypothetical protein
MLRYEYRARYSGQLLSPTWTAKPVSTGGPECSACSAFGVRRNKNQSYLPALHFQTVRWQMFSEYLIAMRTRRGTKG